MTKGIYTMYSQSIMSYWDKKIPVHLYVIFSCVFIVIYMYTRVRKHIKDSFENQDTLINRSSKSKNNLSSN